MSTLSGSLLIRLLLVLGLTLAIFPAQAHDARPAYLELKQLQGGLFEATWKRPEKEGRVAQLAPVFPTHCQTQQSMPERRLPGMRLQKYRLDCGSRGIAGAPLTIAGIELGLHDVLVKITTEDYAVTKVMRADDPLLTFGENLNLTQIITVYLRLGIEHILGGFDHLLFVLGLLFLVYGGLSSLVKAVTAFTLAHSITLCAVTLGWVHIPSAPVEAVIALSILFLALEISHRLDNRKTITVRKPWLAAFGFGLIHGFGFAGALAETGLPSGDIPLALLFFNLGVETGQLLFIVPTYFLLRWLPPIYQLERLAAYAIGSTAAFWVIDRAIALV